MTNAIAPVPAAPAEPDAPSAGHRRGLRWRVFGRAAEEPYRRRGSDVFRFVAGLAVFIALATHANHVSAFDHGMVDAFNSLPNTFEPLFRSVWRLGALWAVLLVGAAALVARRPRLARDLVLAGAIAWGTARVLGTWVVDRNGFRDSLRVLARHEATPIFPLVRLALLTGVVSAASPYMARPARRAGQALIFGVALSALYLGTAYPRDVLGGVVLGWTIAAAIHLIFGSPGGRPTASQLEATLQQLGITAGGIELAAEQPADATVFLARDDRGPLRVKVIGRDDVEAQFLAKCWRFLVYKDSPALHLSRLNQVEHEACMTMLALGAEVRTPAVMYAGRAGPNAVLLVERPIVGRRLIDLPPEEVTDELLRAVWRQVALLHVSRVSHGSLHGGHVVIGPAGPGIVDFALSATADFVDRSAADVAELLAATSAIVGIDRAVAACTLELPTGAVSRAIAYLQPAALSRTTRAAGAGRKETQTHLEALREATATAVSGPVPALENLHRVKLSSLVLAVSALVAVGVLLSQVGDPTEVWATVRQAQWGWVAAAVAFSLLTNLPFAVALMGCVPGRLPLWPTTEVQVAMSYTNLAVPSVGGLALQVRFLQRQGVELASAVAAGGLLSMIGSVVTQIGLFFLAAWLSPDSIDLSALPVTGIAETALAGVLLLGVVAGIALGIPPLRRRVLDPVRHAASAVWSTFRSGRQMSLLILGNVVANVLFVGCLLACLRAFGGGVSFWTALAANTAVTTITGVIPVPGGATALASLGLSGALTTFGVPPEIAVPAVLTHQIASMYLPAVPGWFATKHLLGRDDL
ncbi:MAG: hypothetical protein JWL70_1533 [Acidimicrobiia bacterium]|nr:hypothetical protein [Acidimicrobiia bacterium]